MISLVWNPSSEHRHNILVFELESNEVDTSGLETVMPASLLDKVREFGIFEFAVNRR